MGFRVVEARFVIPTAREASALRRLTDAFEISGDTLDAALEELGFEIARDSGQIARIYTESKGSHHDDLANVFRVLAPYVQGGSLVTLEDTEGERWRYHFDGKACSREEL